MDSLIETKKIWIVIIMMWMTVYCMPPPELPGEEVPLSDISLKKSQGLVTLRDKSKKVVMKWKAPSLDEQLASDPVLIGMGQGALFVPTYTEGRLEPQVRVYTEDAKNDVTASETGHRAPSRTPPRGTPRARDRPRAGHRPPG